MDDLGVWRQELDDARDVLLGRVQPPVDAGVLTLLEVADAYYGRFKEIEQIIMRAESDGAVLRGSKTYKFRTGELRSMIELCKGACDLGIRRSVHARMESEVV
jgi:hypothetical protein